MLNGEITLKIKSGPDNGEITGDVKLKFENEKIVFDKLQFTEPGEYIIEILCDNEEIANSEFTIQVEDEEVISQEDSNEVEEPKDGNRPIIAQIHEPTIDLEPMEMEQPDENQEIVDIAGNVGFTPFVWYKGYQLRPTDIQSFRLYFSNYIPACNVTFTDSTGEINDDDNVPKSNDTFEIFLNSGSDLIKSIHLRFKIMSHKKKPNGDYTFIGLLDVSDLYKEKYKSYQGTSFDVLKKITKELNLGFNSNISNTNDDMRWLQRKIPKKDFINDIVTHSYISDETFLQGYIDFYWCYNYVDIEKEWKRDISKDVGIDAQGVSGRAATDEERLRPLIFSNDKSVNSSSLFFIGSNLKNNSTSKITLNGTKTVVRYYDEKKKNFLQFEIDSLKTDSDDMEVLEGRTYEQIESVSYEYRGKIDTDNVHKNYHYATELNNRNLTNLTNVSITMTLPQPNFNVYLYQKIQLNFIKQNAKLSDDTDAKDTHKLLDQRLTGEWMIINISYNYMNGSLSQNIFAVRKELGKTKEEIEDQQTESKDTEEKEKNENPIEKSDNTIYFIGDMFIVKDKDKRYKITITEIPDNKDIVIADIEELEDVINENKNDEIEGDPITPLDKNIDDEKENIIDENDTIVINLLKTIFDKYEELSEGDKASSRSGIKQILNTYNIERMNILFDRWKSENNNNLEERLSGIGMYIIKNSNSFNIKIED